MSTPTTTLPTEAPTLAEIRASTLGRLVTWHHLACLLAQVERCMVVFSLERDGEASAAAMPIAKEEVLRRAVEGMNRAHHFAERQRIRVSCAANTLYFGAHV